MVIYNLHPTSTLVRTANAVARTTTLGVTAKMKTWNYGDALMGLLEPIEESMDIA